MKKYLFLGIFGFFLSTKPMFIDFSDTAVTKTVSALNCVIKTSGITALGIAGAFGGTYLVVQGWKKAFLDEDKTKNKSFFNNNLTRGLFTAGFGTLTTIGSALLILKSDPIVSKFS